MLEIQGLEVRRGTARQSHTVTLPDLRIPRGEVLAIVGESGCGKSTLLEAIGLLLAPRRLDHYTLGAEPHDVAALLRANDQRALARLRARSLGFVLQSGGLLPFLSVRENIALPRRILGMPALDERSLHAISALKLEPLLELPPAALSLGERQRAAFVRAIAHQPELLLADEPTAALDPHTAHGLFELILRLVGELGLAALVVSHDWKLVNAFGLTKLTAESRPGHTAFGREV